MINENINLTDNITIEVDGIEKNILNLYATIGIAQGSVGINYNVIDKQLFDANRQFVADKYAEFKTAVNNRLTQMEMINI